MTQKQTCTRCKKETNIVLQQCYTLSVESGLQKSAVDYVLRLCNDCLPKTFKLLMDCVTHKDYKFILEQMGDIVPPPKQLPITTTTKAKANTFGKK